MDPTNPSRPASNQKDGHKVEQRQSPFQKAAAQQKRLKLFLYGDSGTGKTIISLKFPRPAVIDLEAGTSLYGGAFDFEVFHASHAYEVMDAVNWLLTHRHNYETLVIDPISVYWAALQKKWSDIFLQRNKASKGYRHEYYDFQVKDWLTIKSELKELIRKISALDMHIVVTAREKPQYADSGFMRIVGTTFDGEKSLPYLFDTIVKLYRDEKGRFLGTCLKDRSNNLPAGEFEVSYHILENLIGRDTLTREATPVQLATAEQVETLRQLIEASGMKEKMVQDRLAVYRASRLEELTEENAVAIIQKLQVAVEKQNAGQPANKESKNAED